MKSIRPTSTEPIAGHEPRQKLGTILVRFIALLAVATALLALAWSRRSGAQAGRRGMNTDPMNENASSPRWLMPVLHMLTRPHSGREASSRFATVSDA